jgi:hypothetical protein
MGKRVSVLPVFIPTVFSSDMLSSVILTGLALATEGPQPLSAQLPASVSADIPFPTLLIRDSETSDSARSGLDERPPDLVKSEDDSWSTSSSSFEPGDEDEEQHRDESPYEEQDGEGEHDHDGTLFPFNKEGDQIPELVHVRVRTGCESFDSISSGGIPHLGHLHRHHHHHPQHQRHSPLGMMNLPGIGRRNFFVNPSLPSPDSPLDSPAFPLAMEWKGRPIVGFTPPEIGIPPSLEEIENTSAPLSPIADSPDNGSSTSREAATPLSNSQSGSPPLESTSPTMGSKTLLPRPTALGGVPPTGRSNSLDSDPLYRNLLQQWCFTTSSSPASPIGAGTSPAAPASGAGGAHPRRHHRGGNGNISFCGSEAGVRRGGLGMEMRRHNGGWDKGPEFGTV